MIFSCPLLVQVRTAQKKTPLVPKLGTKGKTPSAVPPKFAPETARTQRPGNGGRTGRVSTAAPGRTNGTSRGGLQPMTAPLWETKARYFPVQRCCPDAAGPAGELPTGFPIPRRRRGPHAGQISDRIEKARPRDGPRIRRPAFFTASAISNITYTTKKRQLQEEFPRRKGTAPPMISLQGPSQTTWHPAS